MEKGKYDYISHSLEVNYTSEDVSAWLKYVLDTISLQGDTD
ncbi:MAG: hypothetical protein RHS_1230 [Robinsoniella sp. RHS]|nr:MAG: hypothetical protein RHS_1230 [Robinsoniella sp. RHS]